MKVSDLQINDKSVGLIVLSLARECHDFALARGILSHSVEDQLPLVFDILNSHLGYVLHVRDVPAVDATSLASIEIRFSDEGYRLLAKAAQNSMANPAH